MKYNQLILDHFHNPRNVGALAEATAVGQAVNEVCLDKLKLYLRVEDGLVRAASFQAEGCVPSLAAGSFLAEYVVGKAVAHLRTLDAETLLQLLGGLPATKKHAAFLAADAVRSALGGLPKEKI